MAGEDRIHKPGLTETASPNELVSYSFFSLAASLEQIYADAPPIGSTAAPSRERVRFRAAPALGFPPEEVAGIKPAANGHDAIEVWVNLLGLHGPSSPLPASYTERIIHADGAGALGDFLDFFNHRLISLLFQVWRHYRYHLRFAEGAADPFSSLIGALFGLVPGVTDAERQEWRVRLLPHAGVLALNSRSAKVISGLIEAHLGVACRIEEFVWREIDIPEEAQWRLGRADMALGADTIAGSSMPDISGQFRVILGPLSNDQFRSLLPNGAAHKDLAMLVRMTLREPLAWELRLDLSPGVAPDWVLGDGELGWTSMLAPSRDKPVAIPL